MVKQQFGFGIRVGLGCNATPFRHLLCQLMTKSLKLTYGGFLTSVVLLPVPYCPFLVKMKLLLKARSVFKGIQYITNRVLNGFNFVSVIYYRNTVTGGEPAARSIRKPAGFLITLPLHCNGFVDGGMWDSGCRRLS